jgi:glutathione S-transferase
MAVASKERPHFVVPSYGGGFLFGQYSAVDIFFTPVVARFRTYGIRLPAAATKYQDALLGHGLVHDWAELGRNDPMVAGSSHKSSVKTLPY